MSYVKTVALGLDDLLASILLARNDLCISAACGLVLADRDAPLKLNRFQRVTLHAIGAVLDYWFPGHCQGAILGDMARARSSLGVLQAFQESIQERDELYKALSLRSLRAD
jgi:hypothetical protein